nr:phage head closure protein [Ensifer sp. 1H6]
MDRRVKILRLQEIGRNELNEALMDWVAVATVWAQARPNRGDERFEAQQLTGSATMTFHIRYRRELTIEDRISYDGRTWDIRDIRELGRRVVSEFDCVARAD